MDQKLIIKSILTNQDYARAVVSHLTSDMFEGPESRLFEAIKEFFIDHSMIPSEDVAIHLLSELPKTKKEELQHLKTLIEESYDKPIDPKVVPFLVEKTEQWGLERAVYNAIVHGISQLEESNKNFGSVYEKVRAAVGYSFDKSIGHGYFADAELRWELYNQHDAKFSFGLNELDKLTDGGYESGTLNLVVAESNGGKSIALVNVGAAALLQGRNVVYITLEMAEKKIIERFDAKMLNIPVWEVTKKDKDSYVGMVHRLQSKTTGELIVKQYPTSAANALDFRNLLEELRIKRGFKCDLLIVDYLGICADARTGKGDNSYTKLKNVSEDLRALGVEYGIPVFSANQINRAGYGSSDAGMENLSDSMGIAHTADFIWTVYRNEELIESNKAVLKIVKSRYGANDVSAVVGADFAYMSFYDVENSSFDNSGTGKNTRAIQEDPPTISTKTQELVKKSKDKSGFKFG